ncbi:39S ribosomal protein L37, mitochondrial [Gracilinanus agilis]|uniref:39S ribosomal protein L37, mitochondrial n=1 Tax=Gracilinanus agilis TaxID=191870 RepID=UPI001CFE7E2A|nr:39S ribosomal protein L37, mitochondrial [Gracilinanus agilis]
MAASVCGPPVVRALRAKRAAGGCLGPGGPRRCAYEWGVRSTRKPEPPPLDRVYEIPGLEPVTWAGLQYYKPGLARPVFPPWERGWDDPRRRRHVPRDSHPLRRLELCHVMHQSCRLLEGVKQALWLTKSKLIEGLPQRILSLAQEPANHIENQDEQVQKAIWHARLWHSTEDIPKRETYCPIMVDNLLQLCKTKIPQYPALTRRIQAKDYMLSASWRRESTFLQIRGLNGTRLSAREPLAPIASPEEVQATESHVLDTFYPIAPTINLQECDIYDVRNDTGFHEGYPYLHPHTVYFMESANRRRARFRPEQLRAKMIMFAFGNALAQARALYGEEARPLEQPLVVQSVGTDGRNFQFLVFQLNTTDLASSEGVKNLIWMDSDQLLYQHFRCLPVIKKKVVVEPPGIIDYQPETFRKFFALYLHGAA